MSEKLSPDTIRQNLDNYYGTEAYHQWNPFFKVVLTDGVNYLASACGAFWLMDMIASHLQDVVNLKVDSVMIDLKQVDGEWEVKMTDMRTENVIMFKKLDYSDFPLTEGIYLYLMPQADFWVILLPSEY